MQADLRQSPFLCAQLFTVLFEDKSDIDPMADNYSMDNHSDDMRENSKKGLVMSKMDNGSMKTHTWLQNSIRRLRFFAG